MRKERRRPVAPALLPVAPPRLVGACRYRSTPWQAAAAAAAGVEKHHGITSSSREARHRIYMLCHHTALFFQLDVRRGFPRVFGLVSGQ